MRFRKASLIQYVAVVVVLAILAVNGALALVAMFATGASLDQADCSEPLRDPCCPQMQLQAPGSFSADFETNYGSFRMTCVRERAPVWVDRVYNLVKNGYYDNSYFPRVLQSKGLGIVQFGTAGDPQISNVYNYSTTRNKCAILKPQPPQMQYCSKLKPCTGFSDELSNTFGTVSMSTGQDKLTGNTWNTTAELFINIGDNHWLDKLLFIPICTVKGMETVQAFPAFGELADMGGTGPSLGMLYEQGNSYIEANPLWDSMGKTTRVHLLT